MGASRPPISKAVVRTGRPTQLAESLALALALALALNAFILIGGMQILGAQTLTAYAFALLIFLPIALTYMQYVTATRGSESLLDLFVRHGHGLRASLGASLIYLGYASLMAMLAWGAGALLSALLQTVIGVAAPIRLLATASLALLALVHLLTAHGERKPGSIFTQKRLVAAAAVVALLCLGLGQLAPADLSESAIAFGVPRSGVVAMLATLFWVIGLVFDGREASQQPGRSVLVVVLVAMLGGALAGIAAFLMPDYPYVIWPTSSASVAVLSSEMQPPFWMVAFLGAGLVLIALCMERLLALHVALHRAMVHVGFLPCASDRSPDRAYKTQALPSAWPVGVALLLALLLLFAAPIALLTALTALAFLWMTALLNLIEFGQPPRQVVRRRAIRLPFHPLFPGLVLLIGLLLSFSLDRNALAVGVVWLAASGALYYGYARGRVRQQGSGQPEVGAETAPLNESAQTVLVLIVGPRSAVALIQAGAALARLRAANLVVLSVVETPPNSPENLRRFQANEQLAVVNEWIERAEVEPTLTVLPFVRSAANLTAGLADTLQEVRVDLLLLAWETARREEALQQVWQRVLEPEPAAAQTASTDQEDERLPEAVEQLLRVATCDAMILRGELPAPASKIVVVGSGRGAENQKLVALGCSLAASEEAEVSYYFATDAGDQPVDVVPADTGANIPLQLKPVPGDDLEKELVRATRRADLLLINSSHQGLLDHQTVAEMPLRVASKNRHATLIVRGYDGLFRFRLRALWHGLTGLFPSLTEGERGDVSLSMHRAAFPTIDFFVLISLSAMIATFGLLQNSAAVIIGAMLVAPLMSPIVSTAMGVVEGDTHLIRVAIEATTKGIAVAIGIGVVMSLLAPTLPGSEILNRTQPNLLDLAVALASGAAGGYALARKEVSASLPGVSIAVALVPPLCVVGFGIANINVFAAGAGGAAISGLEIAGGALLLFLTNMAAIILAATVVFLVLGFRPNPQRMAQFRRGLLFSMASLLLVTLALAALLWYSVRQIGQQAQLTAVSQQAAALLAAAADPLAAEIVNLEVAAAGDGYLVKTTVYNFGGFDRSVVDQLQRALETDLSQPIQLQATILDATLVER